MRFWFIVLSISALLAPSHAISISRGHGRLEQLRQQSLVLSQSHAHLDTNTVKEYEPSSKIKALVFTNLGDLREAIAHEAGWTNYEQKETTWKNHIKQKGGAVLTQYAPYDFIRDRLGRPIKVVGMVDTSPKYGPASTPAQEYCVANWWHSHKTKYDGQKYEVGHIVAKELGGHCNDPINFFPQTTESNHGVWWRVERMVAATDKVLKQLDPRCNVWIDITFIYESSQIWYPKGGSYGFEVEEGCAQKLIAHAINKKGGSRVAAVASYFYKKASSAVNDATVTAVRDSNGILRTTQGKGRRFTYDWLNQVEPKPTADKHPDLFPGADWPDDRDD